MKRWGSYNIRVLVLASAFHIWEPFYIPWAVYNSGPLHLHAGYGNRVLDSDAFFSYIRENLDAYTYAWFDH